MGRLPVRAGRVAVLACLLLAGFGTGVGRAAPALPSFSTSPALHPGFKWQVRDYAIRCDQSPVTVRIQGASGWRGQVGKSTPRAGSFAVQRSMMIRGSSMTGAVAPGSIRDTP